MLCEYSTEALTTPSTVTAVENAVVENIVGAILDGQLDDSLEVFNPAGFVHARHESFRNAGISHRRTVRVFLDPVAGLRMLHEGAAGEDAGQGKVRGDTDATQVGQLNQSPHLGALPLLILKSIAKLIADPDPVVAGATDVIETLFQIVGIQVGERPDRVDNAHEAGSAGLEEIIPVGLDLAGSKHGTAVDAHLSATALAGPLRENKIVFVSSKPVQEFRLQPDVTCWSSNGCGWRNLACGCRRHELKELSAAKKW